MPSQSFTDPEWESLLKQAGYHDFDSWWNAEAEIVEEGNYRGKDATVSWSLVSRFKLPDGRTIYLKRQQNHYPNNLILKYLRIPTFEVEWKNYLKHKAAGVPTMRIIYYANRKKDGNRQCIIASEELKDMCCLDHLIKWYVNNGWPPRSERLAILAAILDSVKKMHAAGLIHNALYGRHIYMNIPFVDGAPVMPETLKAYFIDLERTKHPGPKSKKLIYRDLKSMFRYIPEWPARDCLWFLKQYLGIDKLTPEAKQIIRDLVPTRKKRRFTAPSSR